jgi:hypothetical protein
MRARVRRGRKGREEDGSRRTERKERKGFSSTTIDRDRIGSITHRSINRAIDIGALARSLARRVRAPRTVRIPPALPPVRSSLRAPQRLMTVVAHRRVPSLHRPERNLAVIPASLARTRERVLAVVARVPRGRPAFQRRRRLPSLAANIAVRGVPVVAVAPARGAAVGVPAAAS